MFVLRSHYTGLAARPKLNGAFALALSLILLPACSMSIPGFGGDDAPAVTGSLAAPVDVQQPLPQSLAYSDATKIGQAADAALWQAQGAPAPGAPNGDWINAATGSSGTVTAGITQEAEEPGMGCRLFNTIVTSIGGVHSYSGRICRGDGGRSVVQIAPTALASPALASPALASPEPASNEIVEAPLAPLAPAAAALTPAAPIVSPLPSSEPSPAL